MLKASNTIPWLIIVIIVIIIQSAKDANVSFLIAANKVLFN